MKTPCAGALRRMRKMAKAIRDGAGKFSYHYPFHATIVTCHGKGKDNAMAVAWHAPI